MTIEKYLEQKKIRSFDFAKKIGVAPFTLERYVAGRIPVAEIVVAIHKATDGNVTPNDFYGVGHRTAAVSRPGGSFYKKKKVVS